jgi:hypothetical protein
VKLSPAARELAELALEEARRHTAAQRRIFDLAVSLEADASELVRTLWKESFEQSNRGADLVKLLERVLGRLPFLPGE